jgi:hypothetical protein
MGEIRNTYNIFVPRPVEKDQSYDIGIDGRIILKCMLGKWGGRM